MRLSARMLVLSVLFGIAVVAAYAATFTLTNHTNEAFSAILHYNDSSSESVHVGASSVQTIDIGSRSVTAVTINGQVVNNGTTNQPVHLTSGVKILVSVSSTGITASTLPVE